MSDTSLPEIEVRTLKLVLEYDGSRFHGWQAQRSRESAGQGRRSLRTVQGEVERAIAEIAREPVRIFGASRTDSGVHALGQAASLVWPASAPALGCHAIQGALNAALADDVAVLSVSEAPRGFHARFDARGKNYRYRILNRRARSPLERTRSYHARARLDVAAMDEAARALVGTHDFACFEASDPARDEDGERSTVRTITAARVRRERDVVEIDVAGDGFLYNMVRAIAGTLLQVGRGKRDVRSMAALLASRDRRRAGPTLPAHGLTLVRVFYEGTPTIDDATDEENTTASDDDDGMAPAEPGWVVRASAATSRR